MSDQIDITTLDTAVLVATRHQIQGAVNVCRVLVERAGDDLAANKQQLAIVDAEIARRAAEDAAEDARQLEAKRRHDEEVARTKAALDAMEQLRAADAAFTAEELEAMRPRPNSFTPEEEGAAAAKVNGQPEAHQ